MANFIKGNAGRADPFDEQQILVKVAQKMEDAGYPDGAAEVQIEKLMYFAGLLLAVFLKKKTWPYEAKSRKGSPSPEKPRWRFFAKGKSTEARQTSFRRKGSLVSKTCRQKSRDFC